ncbi:MAG: hypothetical protein WBW74_13710 [Xanthobacteraceae bacterium]
MKRIVRARATRSPCRGRDYLAGRFTAEDLLMTTVLRILRHTNIVSGRPAMKA